MNSSILVAFVCLFNTYSVPGYAVMRIGWLAGIIGLNLYFGPTPRVGRASNSIIVSKFAFTKYTHIYTFNIHTDTLSKDMKC